MPEMKAEFGWPGGDNPGGLEFRCTVAPALRDALLETLRPHLGEQTEVRALTPPNGAVGRYAVGRHFVRVGARWGDPELEQELTGFLAEQGVPVNHPTHIGLPLEWEGRRLRLDVRPLLTGVHFDGSCDKLQRLSTVLGACHYWLARFPARARVAAHAAERFAEFEVWRVRLGAALERGDWSFFSAEPAWAQRNADWLRMLVGEFRARFDELPGAQCVHAQVHRGNVIFPFSGPAVLLDFEWATHTLAPVSWDLAYFLQRFCLHDKMGPKVVESRLATVREAYGPWAPGVAEMMRQTAFHSIVIVVQQWQTADVRNPLAEYDKFVALEQQAQTLAPLIESFSSS